MSNDTDPEQINSLATVETVLIESRICDKAVQLKIQRDYCKYFSVRLFKVFRLSFAKKSMSVFEKSSN